MSKSFSSIITIIGSFNFFFFFSAGAATLGVTTPRRTTFGMMGVIILGIVMLTSVILIVNVVGIHNAKNAKCH